MVRFNCKYCGYHTESEIKDKTCPYCNKKDAIVQEESAEELVSVV